MNNMHNKYEDDEIEIDLRELLRAIKKKILFILAMAVAGAVLAGAYTQVLVSPVYSSTSKILVLSKETTLTSLTDLQLGTQLANDYSVLITSRPVLENVIENLGLDMEYGALEANVSINNPTGTRILEVTVRNTDAGLARDIVNELSNISSSFIADQMEVVPPKIIEEGELNTRQINSNPIRNAMIGVVAGLILAIGIVVLMTAVNDTIRSQDDIERYLEIPMLASVPDRKDYVFSETAKKKRKKKRRRRGNGRSKSNNDRS